MAIEKVFLDTNALRDGGWPILNVPLTALLQTAQEAGASIVVPELALSEHKANWRRESVPPQMGALKQLKRFCRRFDISFDASAAEAAIHAADAAYDAAVNAAIDEHGIQSVSLPTQVGVSEIVALSIEREAFFPEKDKNFQDCVLAYSIVESLQVDPVEALLVTGDGIFATQEVKQWVASQGVTSLTILNSLKDATRMLRQQAGEGFAERADEVIARAEDAVEAKEDELGAFILDNLDERDVMSLGILDVIGIESIDDVQVLRIIGVATALHDTDGPRGMAISARVVVDLTVKVFDSPAPSFSTLYGRRRAVPEYDRSPGRVFLRKLKVVLRVDVGAKADDETLVPTEFRSLQVLKESFPAWGLPSGEVAYWGQAIYDEEGTRLGQLVHVDSSGVYVRCQDETHVIRLGEPRYLGVTTSA